MKTFFNTLTAALLALFSLVLPASAADAIYPNWKEAAMSGTAGAAVASCDLRAILIDSADYTYSAAHTFLSDVPVAARVAVSGTLGSVTVTDGTLDFADVTFTAVTGDPVEAVIVYCHTGTDGTARLFSYTDTALTGFPVTPNGGDITLTISGSGWFTL